MKVTLKTCAHVDGDRANILTLSDSATGSYALAGLVCARARFQTHLNMGFRRMKIKDYFYPDEDSRSEEENRFYVKKDDWEPPSARVNKALEVHNMVIQNQFDQWKQPQRV